MNDTVERWVDTAKRQNADVPILTIDEMLALPEPQEYDAGVYFCWFKGGLTYIGKSKHICERLYIQDCMNRNGHNYIGTRSKFIPWDKVTCVVLENDVISSPRLLGLLTKYERAYIAAYLPLLNEDFQSGFT